MGSDVDGLNHLADGALANQFTGVDSGLYLQQFAVEDGVDSLGCSGCLADLGQLRQCGHAWLVREDVLVVLHGADRDSGPLVGDLGGEHQLNRWVVQNLILGGHHLRIGKALLEGGSLIFLAPPG